MEIINKVAQSGIVSLDLEEFFPKDEILVFDLKEYLFKGLILREKDFRVALAEINFKEIYSNKIIAVCCTTDAIIPNWAFMLVTVYAQPHAKSVYFGTEAETLKQIYKETLSKIDILQYANQRVVVKGCSNKPVPVEAYLEITKLLRPLAKSIMYGEPCSTIPLFKRKEN